LIRHLDNDGITHLRSCKMSLTLIICIRDVVAAGMMIIGVRDVLLLGGGRASVIGRATGRWATVRLPVDTPSVTDFRDVPWKVLVTSILNSSVSVKHVYLCIVKTERSLMH